LSETQALANKKFIEYSELGRDKILQRRAARD